MREFDVAIVGGGIVGLATAYQLSRSAPQLKIAVLEKEPTLASHQTGRNSGVLHSGIYYKPGSLKAINCRAGKIAMQEFCQAHDVPYDICGKVIVAVDQTEIPALERILERGKANQVQCEMIPQERLRELEPHAAGIRAIHVPEAGIVNYRVASERMAELLKADGHTVATNALVTKIHRLNGEVAVESSWNDLRAKVLVNCAGLQCDRVTRMAGDQPTAKIVPFRGEYFELKPDAQHLCRNLIYPVPNPQFPFLGVHFTRMIEGGVECGPNAVWALAREGYSKFNFNLRDMVDSLTYSGFLKMAMKHWRMGLGEMQRSISKGAFVKALQRLMPEIRADHLVAAPAGVRAQAVLPNGDLVDDFLIVETDRMVHVNNAPSPAATAALNIGRIVSEKVISRFE